MYTALHVVLVHTQPIRSFTPPIMPVGTRHCAGNHHRYQERGQDMAEECWISHSIPSHREIKDWREVEALLKKDELEMLLPPRRCLVWPDAPGELRVQAEAGHVSRVQGLVCGERSSGAEDTEEAQTRVICADGTVKWHHQWGNKICWNVDIKSN